MLAQVAAIVKAILTGLDIIKALATWYKEYQAKKDAAEKRIEKQNRKEALQELKKAGEIEDEKERLKQIDEALVKLLNNSFT